MSILTINLENNINNASLQVGDTAYYVDQIETPNSSSNNSSSEILRSTNSPEKIGKITGITTNSIIINNPNNTPPISAFIMFQKDRNVNNTSLLGYYAEVKLNNSSTEKAELFALSSEITQSSK